jgi:hypothetical protein
LGFERRWFVVRVHASIKASRAELAEILNQIHAVFGRQGTWDSANLIIFFVVSCFRAVF